MRKSDIDIKNMRAFTVKGFIGMWTMKPADAKKVLAQL